MRIRNRRATNLKAIDVAVVPRQVGTANLILGQARLRQGKFENAITAFKTAAESAGDDRKMKSHAQLGL